MPPLNPVKYLRFVWRVLSYGHKARDKTDLNLLEQGREVYRLLRLNQLEPREYYETYELFRREISWQEKKRFLSRHRFAVVDRALNPKRSIGVLNKLVFKVYAERFGLPVPRWYGLFDRNFGFTCEGDSLQSEQDLGRLIAKPDLSSFLFKPISADKAMGIIACRKEEGDLLLLGGGRVALADLYQQLCNTHHSGDKHVADSWLVEERVRQHEWFNRFSETYVHNFRIVTFLTQAGQVELIGAGMGIGLPGLFMHQSGPRGLSAGLSDDGVLTAAARAGKDGLEFFTSHPDTGARIAGERPPLFAEAVKVACRAHKCVPHMRLLGWDLAPTDRGPVIFEGNSYWNWEKLQRGNRRGVIRKSLARELPGILADS